MRGTKPTIYAFLSIVIIFIVSAIIGYVIGARDIFSAQDFIDNQTSFTDGFINSSPWELFAIIFLNNAFEALLAIYLSILFGFFAVYFVVMNGYLLGMFAVVISKTDGIPFFIAGILPHGILELPMELIAASYGLWLGMKFYRRVYYKEKKELYDALKFASIKYLRIILPVLLLAALIEVFITPLVMGKFS